MPKISLRSPITIVVTLEGLATSPLGCYGCSWNETPTIDSLAAGGVVWDRWASPVDRSGGLINRWLNDSRRLREPYAVGNAVFVTDDPKLAVPDDEFGFVHSVVLEPMLKRLPAESVEASVLAETFAASIEAIESDTELLWIHSSALRDHWDAPLVEDDEAEQRVEPTEDEPSDQDVPLPEPFRLPASTDPPAFAISDGDDPDLLFSWMNRYAAQVRLLDQMIDLLFDSLRRRKPIFVLAAASGFSLGENGWVGHHVGPLRSQDIRLPMLISSGGPIRVPSLESAADLTMLLQRLVERKPLISPADWCKTDGEGTLSVQTDSDRAAKAVTTSNWFYVDDSIAPAVGEERLYVKPDDVHDVNDVSRLRREVLDQFANAPASI